MTHFFRIAFLGLLPFFAAGAPEGGDVDRWIEELGHRSLARREEAFIQLQALGLAAHDAIRKALEGCDIQKGAALRYLLNHPVVRQEMVRIPRDIYIIGSRTRAFRNRERKAPLDAFLIDRYEVTCFMYHLFIRSTGRPAPPHWKAGRHAPGCENHPVTGITFHDAAAYASWAGKRLPIEEEWEAAASGPKRALYPWGDRVHLDGANVEGNGLAAVGSFSKDKSSFGCFDMVGNASEWVRMTGDGNNPQPARKGAAYTMDFCPPHAALCFGAVRLPPERRLKELGFRCVRDLEVVEK